MGKGRDQFEYYTGTGKAGKMMKRYGVEGTRFNHPDGRSNGETGARTMDDVDKDIGKAMSQDYDTRRSLEAAAMSGNKKAKKIINNGFDSTKDIYKAQAFFDKAAKKQGYKSFDSTSDYASLTQHFVNQDRNAQTAAYDETYAKTTDLNALKDKLMAEATEKAAGAGSDPIEPSERMAAVEDRLEKAAGGGNTPPSLFDKDNAQPAKADDQADASRNFLEDYTADVREGANIRSDINAGVSNAARHVRDTYGR